MRTEVRFAAWMLALIVLVHYGYHLDEPSIQSRVFYVARGALGAVLFLVLAQGRSVLEVAVLTYGACEEVLTAVCGSWYLWHPNHPFRGWANGYGACQAPTGFPFTALGLCAIGLLLAWIVQKLKGET